MAKKEAEQFPGAFSLLRPSANAVLFNIWTFAGLFIVGVVINVVTSGAEDQLDSPPMLFLYVISIVSAIAIAPASTVVALHSVKEKKIDLLDAIQEGLPFALRIFLMQILTVLIILGGLLLLIVPGVIAFQRLLLAQYYLIDQDLGIIDSLKASWADAKEFPGALWGLIGVILAYLLLMVTIILIPVSIALLIAYICAPAIRYYQIRAAAKNKA